MLAAVSLVFGLVHLSGDPTAGFLAPGTSPEVRDAARERLGLNDPIAWQYASTVGRAFAGDFGESWRNRQPALNAVLDRLPATLLLATAAIIVSVVGGLTLGILSARLQSGVIRASVRGFALLGQAFPAFWLGMLGIVVFAVRLQWLPASGNDGWRALILPALTLAAYPGSLIARVTQASLLDVRARPYVTNAHAKGLPDHTIWLRHMLPNALLPALAIVGLQAGFLVGGAIVVESVFAYPGLGRLALQATSERDLPVIQAFVAVSIMLVSLVNLVVDLVAAWIDPALRQRSVMAVANG
jgi:peptide/nickel transport system permease protein